MENCSFRDPAGFVFRRNGVIYRQINKSAAADYGAFVKSGLYDKLVSGGLLVPHEETAEPGQSGDCFSVIKPEQIQFISYPYEWCFSQLKDAALLTLAAQKTALACGFSLKDASAYNAQFRRGGPVLIDTLSFEPYADGAPWAAYGQFCRHFLAPLALMAHSDARLNLLCGDFIDGIPLDLAASLLPRRTLLKFSLLSHIHLHARAQRHYEGRSAAAPGKMSRFAQLSLIDSLESAVAGLNAPRGGSAWSGYYGDNNYSPEAFESKKRIVAAFIAESAPKRVWDIGANNGEFSRLASAKGIDVVAFDSDHGAVESAYLRVKAEGDGHLLPLVTDFTNPGPALGWAGEERQSLEQRAGADLIMALAFVHHLAIADNVPLSNIAQYFARLGGRLVMEFVPKEDSQARRLLASRKDIFPDYCKAGLEAAFSRYFDIEKTAEIAGSPRILYLMKVRSR